MYLFLAVLCSVWLCKSRHNLRTEQQESVGFLRVTLKTKFKPFPIIKVKSCERDRDSDKVTEMQFPTHTGCFAL